jgi:hypothetical protein
MPLYSFHPDPIELPDDDCAWSEAEGRWNSELGFSGAALVHQRAERELVDEAAVDARDRDRAARPASIENFS